MNQARPEPAYTRNSAGIYLPDKPIVHRDDHYDPRGFQILVRMQEKHFWYRGRHRFVWEAVKRWCPGTGLSGLDVGGGCGGWIRYLSEAQAREMSAPPRFSELAVGDSSLECLGLAESVVPPQCRRFQCDLLALSWSDRWDVMFLLDVLEHIPDHQSALFQVKKALRPGGSVVLTTPALAFFWSKNDEWVHHQRRYSRRDFCQLAREVGFEIVAQRYFMFLLSPLVFASRASLALKNGSPEQIEAYLEKSHQVPAPWLNRILGWLFERETPWGHRFAFPWGTSLCTVLRKPLS